MASFIAYSLGGLMGIGLIANIEPIMTVFIAFAILNSFFLSSHRNRLNFRYSEKISNIQAKEQYIHRVFYMKDYVKELRSLQKLPTFMLGMLAKVEEENSELTKRYGKKSFYYSMLGIVNNRVLMYWLIMLLTIGIIYMRENIEPGNLLIMTVSVGTTALLIGAIVNIVPEMNKIMMYYQKLTKFLEEPRKRKKDATVGKTVIDKIESIEFDHVSFTYPNEERAVLHDISFKVCMHERLSIVGVNGSGKSTILKLILKFYSPDKGNNPFTIAENLLLRPLKTVVDERLVWEALDRVDLSDKVWQLPSGLSTPVTKEFNNDGVVFSGGECQRIALARAFLQDTPFSLWTSLQVRWTRSRNSGSIGCLQRSSVIKR